MATVSDYLTQLQQDKSDLVTNLTEMGIADLTGEETFTELVPKVLDIQTGADLSEYFYNSISVYNSAIKPTIAQLIKKIPAFTYAQANGSNLFAYCKATEIDLSGIDFSVMTNAENMFSASTIESIIGQEKLLNNNITSMNYMFMNANISAFDFSKLNTSKCTKMNYMFNAISGLTVLDLTDLDVSNVTTMEGIFESNRNVTSIDISGWNMEKLNTVTGMFNFCNNLTTLNFGINLGKGFTSAKTFSLQVCNNLTHDSLMSVINNLYDLTTKNLTSTLALGSTNKAKLTEAEIQIATDKGWTVS